MVVPKTKSELLHAMESGRREWDTILAQIDEQSLSEPGVEGIWSVKQIVAHVAGYEEWTATFLSDRLDPGAGILAAYDALWQEQLDAYRQDHPDFPAHMNETNEDENNQIHLPAIQDWLARREQQIRGSHQSR